MQSCSRFAWTCYAAFTLVIIIGMYAIISRPHVHSTFVEPHNLPY
jgi:hypothetical protein